MVPAVSQWISGRVFVELIVVLIREFPDSSWSTVFGGRQETPVSSRKNGRCEYIVR